MTKEEVELIIFKVTAVGQEAFNMKIYKNGTTCRHGVGGLPQLGISGMSFFNSSVFFDALITKVPEQLLERPMNYEEETPNGYLEYVIAFYGVSNNAETGEDADWTKSTGIRAKLDQKSNFRDPIIGFLDGLTLDAAELTNEWYFDIMMLAKYKMQSSTMPKETILAQPKTENEIDNDYENYINMMMTSARNWSMANFDKNKTYEREGKSYTGIIHQDEQLFSVNFIELGNSTFEEKSTDSTDNGLNKKPWWKIW
jgi:hypothetical protein